MNDIFKRFYHQAFSNPEQLLSFTIRVLAVFALVVFAWWIFNAIMRKVEKTYHARPFFEKNDRLFVLIKRAGNYSILALAV
jgi:hypothetical protein